VQSQDSRELFDNIGWKFDESDILFRSRTSTLQRINKTLSSLAIEADSALGLRNFLLSTNIVQYELVGDKQIQKLLLLGNAHNRDRGINVYERTELDYTNIKRLVFGLGELSRIRFELTNLSGETFHLTKNDNIIIGLTFFRVTT